jgi:hypothetical protein
LLGFGGLAKLNNITYLLLENIPNLANKRLALILFFVKILESALIQVLFDFKGRGGGGGGLCQLCTDLSGKICCILGIILSAENILGIAEFVSNIAIVIIL